jgi:hypothetical protein
LLAISWRGSKAVGDQLRSTFGSAEPSAEKRHRTIPEKTSVLSSGAAHYSPVLQPSHYYDHFLCVTLLFLLTTQGAVLVIGIGASATP